MYSISTAMGFSEITGSMVGKAGNPIRFGPLNEIGGRT